MNRGIPAVIARGGASRGVLVLESDLHEIPEERWESLFALWSGSPDPSGRQIDGVGGGNPSTSKVVVLRPSTTAGRDLDYTFFQIDPITGRSERRGTCGNLTAAAGLLAVTNGLVPAASPTSLVRLRDTNTGHDVDVEVPLGAIATSTTLERVDYRARRIRPLIRSTFLAPAGATTGELYPTGSARQDVEIGGRQLTVTLIDAVNPVVLIDGDSIGVDATLAPAELEADEGLMGLLAEVRAWGAVQCRFADAIESVPEQSWFLPYVGLTFTPRPYSTVGGDPVAADDVDVVIRMMSGPTVHRALPLSAGLALAGATRLADPGPLETPVRLGHPSGVLAVDVASAAPNALRSISVESTARLIMSGYLDVE